jgi:hypothetical protein
MSHPSITEINAAFAARLLAAAARGMVQALK